MMEYFWFHFELSKLTLRYVPFLFCYFLAKLIITELVIAEI